MHRVDADQLGPVFQLGPAQALQPFAQHRQRQFPAGAGTRAGVGYLSFADETVAVAQCGLQRLGPLASAGTTHPDPVGADLCEAHPEKSATTSACR